MPTTIGAGEFKTKCLNLLDEVANSRQPLIITKHGKAVAQLVPMPLESELFDAMAHSARYEGDIFSPVSDEWDACVTGKR